MRLGRKQKKKKKKKRLPLLLASLLFPLCLVPVLSGDPLQPRKGTEPASLGAPPLPLRPRCCLDVDVKLP